MDNIQETRSTPSQAPRRLPLPSELADNSFLAGNHNYQHIHGQNYAYNTHLPTTPTHTPELRHGILVQNQHYTLHSYGPLTTPVHPAPYNNSTPTPACLSLQMPSSPVLFDNPKVNFKTDINGLRTSPRRNKHDSGRVVDNAEAVSEPLDDSTPAGNKTKEKKGKESKPKAAKGTRKQAKGRGSKSGANARDAGKSDEEVKTLSGDAKSRAAIPAPTERARWTDDEKEKALSYIVDDKRWPNFKINQNVIFNYVRSKKYLLLLDLIAPLDISAHCSNKDK